MVPRAEDDDGPAAAPGVDGAGAANAPGPGSGAAGPGAPVTAFDDPALPRGVDIGTGSLRAGLGISGSGAATAGGSGATGFGGSGSVRAGAAGSVGKGVAIGFGGVIGRRSRTIGRGGGGVGSITRGASASTSSAMSTGIRTRAHPGPSTIAPTMPTWITRDAVTGISRLNAIRSLISRA